MAQQHSLGTIHGEDPEDIKLGIPWTVAPIYICCHNWKGQF